MFENDRASYELQKYFGIGTPLHEAVVIGRIDVIDALLARGTDPNVKDFHGKSAIEKAERDGKTNIVERLHSTQYKLKRHKDVDIIPGCLWYGSPQIASISIGHYILSYSPLILPNSPTSPPPPPTRKPHIKKCAASQLFISVSESTTAYPIL